MSKVQSASCRGHAPARDAATFHRSSVMARMVHLEWCANPLDEQFFVRNARSVCERDAKQPEAKVRILIVGAGRVNGSKAARNSKSFSCVYSLIGAAVAHHIGRQVARHIGQAGRIGREIQQCDRPSALTHLHGGGQILGDRITE